MKALSIRQPWAYLIVTGYKDIENRTWPTKFRGRIYVHAGKHFDREGCHYFRLEIDPGKFNPLLLGAIVGSVDIVDCVTKSSSPWFSGPYGFVLANPKAYKMPLPCKGALYFFKPEINDATG